MTGRHRKMEGRCVKEGEKKKEKERRERVKMKEGRKGRK